MLEDVQFAEWTLPPPYQPLVHTLPMVGVATGQGSHLRPHLKCRAVIGCLQGPVECDSLLTTMGSRHTEQSPAAPLSRSTMVTFLSSSLVTAFLALCSRSALSSSI